MHVNGWGTPKDPAKAFALWKEGAELADPMNMYFYAMALEGGLVAAPQPAEARKWYILAAKKKNAPAREWCQRNGIVWTEQP